VAEKTSEQSASKKERIAVDKKSTHTQSWKTVPDLMTPRDVKNADGKNAFSAGCSQNIQWFHLLFVRYIYWNARSNSSELHAFI